MKAIAIDLESYPGKKGNLVQAAKIFLTKNKTTLLYLIGEEKDLTTVKNTNRILPVIVRHAGEDEKDSSFYLDECYKAMKENKCRSLFTFRTKEEILNTLDSVADEFAYPLLTCNFLSKSPNRFCLLGDLGLRPSLTGETFFKAKDSLSLLSRSAFHFSSPSYSLLAPSQNLDDLLDNVRDAYDLFEGKEGFLGVSTPEEMMSGKADIYLADGFVSKMVVDAYYSCYTLYKDKYDAYAKQDFFARRAISLGKSMINNVESSTSAKLDATGRLLFGYDPLILFGNENVNISGLVASLLFLSQAMDALPEEKKEEN